MTRPLVLLLSSLCLVGCLDGGTAPAGLEGRGPTGVPGGSLDYVALIASAVGNYGAIANQVSYRAELRESDASNSHFPRLEAVLTTDTLDSFAVDLTFIPAEERFVGFAIDLCDDPGCTQIDSLALQLYRTTNESFVMDYQMRATVFSEDPESEPNQSVGETASFIKQAAPKKVGFSADSALPEDVQRLMTEIIDENCSAAFQYASETEEIYQDAGETYYSAAFSMTPEGAQEDTYLSIVRTESGELEVVEYMCPEL